MAFCSRNRLVYRCELTGKREVYLEAVLLEVLLLLGVLDLPQHRLAPRRQVLTSGIFG